MLSLNSLVLNITPLAGSQAPVQNNFDLKTIIAAGVTGAQAIQVESCCVLRVVKLLFFIIIFFLFFFFIF